MGYPKRVTVVVREKERVLKQMWHPKQGIVPNGGIACEDSYAHGVCGRAGVENAGRMGKVGA